MRTLTLIALALVAGIAFAQYSPGNLVVRIVGDGGDTTGAQPTRLREYTISIGSFSLGVEQWNFVSGVNQDLATGAVGTSEVTLTSNMTGDHSDMTGGGGSLQAEYLVGHLSPTATKGTRSEPRAAFYSLAQNIGPAGSVTIAERKVSTAFLRPSPVLMSPSSCSMLNTKSYPTMRRTLTKSRHQSTPWP